MEFCYESLLFATLNHIYSILAITEQYLQL